MNLIQIIWIIGELLNIYGILSFVFRAFVFRYDEEPVPRTRYIKPIIFLIIGAALMIIVRLLK